MDTQKDKETERQGQNTRRRLIERQKNIYKTKTQTINSKLEMDKENRDIQGQIVRTENTYIQAEESVYF